MKAKILLLTAIAAAIVYSCSTERDEQEQIPVSKKVDVETKTNNNQDQNSKVGDSIDAPSHQDIILDPGTGLDPNPNPTDPNEGDPKDVVPPRR